MICFWRLQILGICMVLGMDLWNAYPLDGSFFL